MHTECLLSESFVVIPTFQKDETLDCPAGFRTVGVLIKKSGVWVGRSWLVTRWSSSGDNREQTLNGGCDSQKGENIWTGTWLYRSNSQADWNPVCLPQSACSWRTWPGADLVIWSKLKNLIAWKGNYVTVFLWINWSPMWWFSLWNSSEFRGQGSSADTAHPVKGKELQMKWNKRVKALIFNSVKEIDHLKVMIESHACLNEFPEIERRKWNATRLRELRLAIIKKGRGLTWANDSRFRWHLFSLPGGSAWFLTSNPAWAISKDLYHWEFLFQTSFIGESLHYLVPPGKRRFSVFIYF